MITIGQTDPGGLAVDGQHLYWANLFGNTIGRANLDGTGVNESFITGASSPYGVAVDGQHVYWANFDSGTIGRANLDGTGVDQSFIAGADLPSGLAVDALQPPTESITTPASGATYTQGQVVDSSFSCAEGTAGPGIASCLDQNGQTSGSAIDTSTIGPHTLTVTATSGDGATGTASVTYAVAAPPTPSSTPPSSDPTSTSLAPATPVLDNLKQSHPRWREGGTSAQISSHKRRPPVGTAFSFTLNQPAAVKLVFTERVSGRVVKVNSKPECAAQTKHNEQNRRCARILRVASLSFNAHSGTDRIVFDGRVSPTHRLRPGRYTVTITATNASGMSSKPQALRFTIVS